MRGRPDLNRPVLFFGGKGGVGKTTLAASAAVYSAASGARTLLVSTDLAHSAGDVLGMSLGGEVRAVESSLWALEIDPAREIESYIAEVRSLVDRVTPPRLAAEVERQIDIARVSPGAEEAAVFDRFTRILQMEGQFDRVIFDTAPTGPTLRLLTLPETLSAWVAGLISRRRKVSALGRMWSRVAGAVQESGESKDPVLEALKERSARFSHARRVMTDPANTAFMFVMTPERLPILETHRSVSTLTRYEIPIGGIFVNQVLPEGSGGKFLQGRRDRQADRLAEIEHLFTDWPLSRVPLLEVEPVGLDALRALMSHIASPSVEAVE